MAYHSPQERNFRAGRLDGHINPLFRILRPRYNHTGNYTPLLDIPPLTQPLPQAVMRGLYLPRIVAERKPCRRMVAAEAVAAAGACRRAMCWAASSRAARSIR